MKQRAWLRRLARRVRLAIRRDPATLLAAAHQDGDTIQLAVGPKRLVILNHPASVEQVLRVHHKRFTKGRAHTRAQRWLGKGILVSEGDEHHRQRRLLMRALQPQHVAACGAAIIRQATALGDTWHDGEARNLWQDMLHLATANIAAAIWGDGVAIDASAVSAALDHMAAWLGRGGSPLVALRDWRMLPGSRETQRVQAWLDALIDDLTNRHQDDHSDCVLATLRQTNDPAITPAFLHNQFLTLLLGGRETTAAALIWTWHLLASHPDIQRQVHGELDRVLRERTPAWPDIEQFVVLENVIREALRLYPPAWSTVRRANQNCHVNGTDIPAGSVVVMSQYVLHRDRRWFAQPEQFCPERWHHGPAAYPKGAYFPFGIGPRRCIGEPFAWAEIILTIATLAQHWQVEAVPGSPTTLRPGTSLQPAHAITLRVVRRKPHTA